MYSRQHPAHTPARVSRLPIYWPLHPPLHEDSLTTIPLDSLLHEDPCVQEFLRADTMAQHFANLLANLTPLAAP